MKYFFNYVGYNGAELGKYIVEVENKFKAKYIETIEFQPKFFINIGVFGFSFGRPSKLILFGVEEKNLRSKDFCGGCNLPLSKFFLKKDGLFLICKNCTKKDFRKEKGKWIKINT